MKDLKIKKCKICNINNVNNEIETFKSFCYDCYIKHNLKISRCKNCLKTFTKYKNIFCCVECENEYKQLTIKYKELKDNKIIYLKTYIKELKEYKLCLLCNKDFIVHFLHIKEKINKKLCSKKCLKIVENRKRKIRISKKYNINLTSDFKYVLVCFKCHNVFRNNRYCKLCLNCKNRVNK